MRRPFAPALLTALLLCLLQAGALRAETVELKDEDNLLLNIRKTLSIPPGIRLRIADVKQAPMQDLLQGMLELSADTTTVLRRENIFVSKDSRYFFIGNLYDTSVDMDALRRGMLNLERSPSRGKADAPVTVVVFSDFQCESCKHAHDMMLRDKVIESYEGKVRFVFKNLPIIRHHQWALPAAVAALCARKQDSNLFWRFQDMLFIRQNEIVPANVRAKMLEFAKEINLNAKKFTACYDKQETRSLVDEDMAEAQALGIFQTPTFLINGRVLVGYRSTPEFKQMVDEFLGAKKP